MIYLCLEQSDAALTVAIARSADIIARVSLAIISLMVSVKARYVAHVGVIALIFVRIGKFILTFLHFTIELKLWFFSIFSHFAYR